MYPSHACRRAVFLDKNIGQCRPLTLDFILLAICPGTKALQCLSLCSANVKTVFMEVQGFLKISKMTKNVTATINLLKKILKHIWEGVVWIKPGPVSCTYMYIFCNFKSILTHFCILVGMSGGWSVLFIYLVWSIMHWMILNFYLFSTFIQIVW